MPDHENHTELCAALGLSEEPYACFYTDTPPPDAIMPKPFTPIAQQIARNGQVDLKATRENFTCVLGALWRARRKHTAACFSAEHFGCTGASFFLGFHRPQIDTIANFISTGIPGTPMHGERYLDSPEKSRHFFEACDAGLAPAPYCVFKPLSQCAPAEVPLLLVFFVRPEVLSGLFTLTAFVSDTPDAVQFPFGAGCTNLVAWPRRYLAEGRQCAVVGGMDPSCRPYLQTDEMTFTVPWALYQRFLTRWQDSFLKTETWETVLKKVARSERQWAKESVHASAHPAISASGA